MSLQCGGWLLPATESKAEVSCDYVFHDRALEGIPTISCWLHESALFRAGGDEKAQTPQAVRLLETV